MTYTVMDDLEVRPTSTVSTIALISKLKVEDISSLQERVVELGMQEVHIQLSKTFIFL